ncbi:hypothetical protein YC2023_038923 [Brassica napus]
MAQKVEAQGGKGGNQWDDGSEHDAVIKIQVGAGGIGIQYVKFDYVKNGQTEEAPLRGIKGRSIAADPFVISHPGEHLVSVEGWYNPEGLHQGLKFKSNKKTSDLIGYDDGTHFTLQVQDKKIVGFHGFAGDYVHSLGAYFSPLTSSTTLTPAKKLPALGSDEGTAWDDGAYHGVKKVFVGQGHDGVSAVKFEYVNGSQVVIGGERGKPTLLGFEEADQVCYIKYPRVRNRDDPWVTVTSLNPRGRVHESSELEDPLQPSTSGNLSAAEDLAAVGLVVDLTDFGEEAVVHVEDEPEIGEFHQDPDSDSSGDDDSETE